MRVLLISLLILIIFLSGCSTQSSLPIGALSQNSSVNLPVVQPHVEGTVTVQVNSSSGSSTHTPKIYTVEVTQGIGVKSVS